MALLGFERSLMLPGFLVVAFGVYCPGAWLQTSGFLLFAA